MVTHWDTPRYTLNKSQKAHGNSANLPLRLRSGWHRLLVHRVRGIHPNSSGQLITKASIMPGEMRTTISLKPVSWGTELSIVQEGMPEAIPVEMCYLGGKSRWCCWES